MDNDAQIGIAGLLLPIDLRQQAGLLRRAKLLGIHVGIALDPAPVAIDLSAMEPAIIRGVGRCGGPDMPFA